MSEESLEEMAQGNFKRESGHTKQLRLQDQVRHPKLWPTPAARDYKGMNGYEATKAKIESGQRGQMGQLPNAVMMEQGKGGGQLNPVWVEWLMGFPSGWTDLNS